MCSIREIATHRNAENKKEDCQSGQNQTIMKKRWFILLVFPLALILWRPASRPETSRTPTLAKRVQKSTQTLHQVKTGVEAKSSFLELKAALRQMEAKEAREWILTALASGEDFSTQLDLTLDAGQNLAAWPSWRVFLLDLLFLTDREAAATLSRDLLQQSQSPDEWAVCLRNLARVGKDDALLKTKSAELLRRKDWRKNPSAGYLEAFDVIVHTKQTALAPELLANCDAHDEKAVRHASFLTLDRLVMAEPARMLPELVNVASKHPKSGLMLSNMIARADLRDTKQRQAVETYLIDPKRTPEELQGFASVFPNANVAVSQNLLSTNPTIQGVDLAARDRASLEVVSAWLIDDRFKSVHKSLRTIAMRLESWRSSSNR